VQACTCKPTVDAESFQEICMLYLEHLGKIHLGKFLPSRPSCFCAGHILLVMVCTSAAASRLAGSELVRSAPLQIRPQHMYQSTSLMLPQVKSHFTRKGSLMPGIMTFHNNSVWCIFTCSRAWMAQE